jgi:hypothetical protein
MNKYFIKIHQDLMAKNKLQAAIKELVKEHDYTLVKGDDALNALIEKTKADVLKLNEQYSKCKAEDVRLYDIGMKRLSGLICIGEQTSLIVYDVKREKGAENA